VTITIKAVQCSSASLRLRCIRWPASAALLSFVWVTTDKRAAMAVLALVWWCTRCGEAFAAASRNRAALVVLSLALWCTRWLCSPHWNCWSCGCNGSALAGVVLSLVWCSRWCGALAAMCSAFASPWVLSVLFCCSRQHHSRSLATLAPPPLALAVLWEAAARRKCVPASD
jgi:hypothetical protein